MAANSMTLPEGFVLDQPQGTGNLPEGFVLDENIKPEKYISRSENPFLKAAGQFTAGLYGGTRFLPPVRFLGLRTGAEDIYQNLPKAETLPERVAQGAGYVAPTLIGAQPFIRGASLLPFLARRSTLSGAAGFGGFEATKKLLEGQPEEALPAAASGFGSGLAFGVGGKLGASALRRVPFTTISINPRIGSMAGGAAAGAITSPEDTTTGAILGGGFGAVFPSKPFGKTSAQLQKESVDIWRGLIRPEKGEIKTIEGDLRKGQKIDDFLRIGAKENLPLSKTPEGKLDTSDARQIVSEKQQQIQNQLEKLLASKPQKKFDLFDVQNRAYKLAEDMYKNGRIPATDLESMKQDIFQYIQSEIGQKNSYLTDALTLHRLKQGMWKTGYNAMRPTTDKSARLIGSAAREMIEEAFPKGKISNLNKQSGQYQVLDTLLLNANGRIIPQGRIGQYFSRGVGTALGAGVGQLVPIPGVGTAAGGAIGYKLGGKVQEFMTSPERLSKVAGLKMRQAMNPSVPFDVMIGQQVGKKLSQRGGFADYGSFGGESPAWEQIAQPGANPQGKVGIGEGDAALIEKAKKYKTAEEFVKAQNLYHGTSSDIQGDKLSFGAGKIRKGGQSGGLFLSDTPESAQVFGKIVYQANPEIKTQVIDLTKPEGIKRIKNYIGKTYKTFDGEIVTFTQQDFESMFPQKKADFASLSQFPELVEKAVTDAKMRGIAFNEYAGGKIGKTYQILKGDIPIKTADQLTSLWQKAHGKQSVTTKVKNFFGTTKDINEAGYISADGDLIDFSGKHEAVGYEKSIPKLGEPDYLKGQRNIDHREIGKFVGDYNQKGIDKFLNEGNIRIDTNSGGIQIGNVKPNQKQLDHIRDIADINNGAIVLDIGGGKNPLGTFHASYDEGTNTNKIIKDINTFFSGRIPDKYLNIAGLTAAGTLMAGQAQAGEQKTLGQKNNNPINLKAFDKWYGMTGKDKDGHAIFKSLDFGIRAGLRNLKTHQRENPNQTLNQYLNKFAEKNGTKEAAFVADSLGISADARLKTLDMEKVIIPLAEFESKIKLTPADIKRVNNTSFPKKKFGKF